MLTNRGKPKCYEEDLQIIAKAEWELSIHDKIASLMEDQTWDFVELPKRKRALHNK